MVVKSHSSLGAFSWCLLSVTPGNVQPFPSDRFSGRPDNDGHSTILCHIQFWIRADDYCCHECKQQTTQVCACLFFDTFQSFSHGAYNDPYLWHTCHETSTNQSGAPCTPGAQLPQVWKTTLIILLWLFVILKIASAMIYRMLKRDQPFLADVTSDIFFYVKKKVTGTCHVPPIHTK